jgi:hypothetical protein
MIRGEERKTKDGCEEEGGVGKKMIRRKRRVQSATLS